MKRILLVVTMAIIVAALVMATSAPSFAQVKGSENKGHACAKGAPAPFCVIG